MNSNTHAPLNVIVVGAGIGGLSAAIALRRAGHYVEVLLALPSFLLARVSDAAYRYTSLVDSRRNWEQRSICRRTSLDCSFGSV